MTADEANALRCAADVLASSHRWLKREAEFGREQLGADDGMVDLYVEAEQLDICLSNLEQIAGVLRDLTREWDSDDGAF